MLDQWRRDKTETLRKIYFYYYRNVYVNVLVVYKSDMARSREISFEENNSAEMTDKKAGSFVIWNLRYYM